jgi:uncharacterized membrane protein
MLGWVAAFFGGCDLLCIWRENDRKRLVTAIVHWTVNGSVLVGFTCLLAAEYPRYPSIAHGHMFLAVEIALLCTMILGNYFGGALVWGRPPADRPPYRA